MAVTLGLNIASLGAQRALDRAVSSSARTAERLSSGLRINRASDDAAGLSVASSLHGDSCIFNQALRNVNDGISLLNIAEGAVAELGNITERIRELATQAANGTLADTQRVSVDREAQALRDEYNRIVSSTSFNGQSLLDRSTGSVEIQAGYGSGAILTANPYSGLERSVPDGTFAPAVVYAKPDASSNYGTAAVGDINGDGKLDVALTENGRVGFYVGNGDGTFLAQSVSVSSGGGTGSTVNLVDVNNDSCLDFVVASNNGVNVALGNGNGTFKVARSFSTLVQNYTSVSVADVNGDGRPDILTSGGGIGTFGVLLSNGDGTFRAPLLQGTVGALGNALDDVNGDGKADLFIAIARR